MSVIDRLTGRGDAERTDSTGTMSTDRRAVCLSLVAVVAAVVRTAYLAEESLWLDEVTTVVARTGMPLRELIATAAQSSPHPPLYFVFLTFWFDVLGVSPFTARLFSVGVGVAAVLLIYLVGRRLFDETTGLAAALFLAVSPFHVQYSREARMYALMVLFALASYYYFVRLTRGDRTPTTVVGYVVATVLLLYTHIYGGFIVLAQNAHVVIPWIRRERTAGPSVGPWVVIQTVVGLTFLPWLYLFREEFRTLLLGEGSSDAASLVGWLPDPSPELLADAVLSYAGYVTNYPFGADGGYSRAIGVGVGAIFLALVWIGFLGYREEAPEYDLREYLRRYRLLVFWFVAVAFVPYAVAEYLLPIYYPRYTIAALPALYLLVARGISSVDSSRLRRATVLLVAVCLLAGTGIYHTTPTDGNWRGAGNYIEEEAQEGALVLVDPGYVDRPIEYYVDRIEIRIAPLGGTEAIANGSNGSFWVVTSKAYSYDRKRLDELNESYELSKIGSFGDVRVYRYGVGSGNSNADRRTAGADVVARSNRH